MQALSEGRSCARVHLEPGFCSVSECLVKCSNCGFLSGARLSGSLPCLHSLNAPLSQSFAGVWLRHKNTQDLGTGFSSDFCSQSGVFFFLSCNWIKTFFFFLLKGQSMWCVISSDIDYLSSKKTYLVLSSRGRSTIFPENRRGNL